MKWNKKRMLVWGVTSLLIWGYSGVGAEDPAPVKTVGETAVEKLLNNSTSTMTDDEKTWIKNIFSMFDGKNIDRSAKILVSDSERTIIGMGNKGVEDDRGRSVLGSYNVYNRMAMATLGHDNANLGGNSYIMGYQASTFAKNSIAIGSWAKAFPMRLANGLQETNQYGVEGEGTAIGTHAWASGLSNAYGHRSRAIGTGSVAVGSYAWAGSKDISDMNDGFSFSELQQKYEDKFGQFDANESEDARAEKVGKIVFEEYKPAFKDMGITTFEEFKRKFSREWKTHLEDLGTQLALNPVRGGSFSTAIGTKTHAQKYGSIAIGYESIADRGTAPYNGIVAPFSNEILNANNTLGALSVGNENVKRQIINVASGTEDNDAVNLMQLKGAVKYISFNDTSENKTEPTEDISNKKGDMAFGAWSTALGAWAKAGDNGTTLGTSSSSGYQSVAIGNFSKANYIATAVGYSASVSGNKGVAIGGYTEVTSEKGVALGVDSIASRERGALGNTLQGKQNSVEDIMEAIGQKEEYKKAEKIVDDFKDEYNALIDEKENAADDTAKAAAQEKIDKFKQDHPDFLPSVAKWKALNATWQATDGAVSIGNKNRNMTRQLTGLAAGSEDTDAVNVAQLKALAKAPINFFNGGTLADTTKIYTPSTDKWSGKNIVFGKGLKAEKVKDDKGSEYTYITLDENEIKNNPNLKGQDGKNGKSAFDIWKESDPKNKDKKEKDFLASIKGENGKDGKNGKSAFDTWKESDPKNKDKKEKDFLASIKGENGKNGKDGKSAFDTWKESDPKNKDKKEKDFLESIKGEKGQDGKNGKSAFDIWKEKPGNKDKTEEDFLKETTGIIELTVSADKKGEGITSEKPEFAVTKKSPTLKMAGDGGNIYTTIEKDNTVKVELNKNIKVDSVEVGGKDGVKIDKNGIDMHQKKITNVAAGTDDGDVATVGQMKVLEKKTGDVAQAVGDVKKESTRGDAMGAALTALKPLAYDPYRRSQMMAGVGTYKGKQAVALGWAHYSNENTLFHGGISYGGTSDVLANVGMSIRFGDSTDKKEVDRRNTLLPRYAEGPMASVYLMQEEIEILRKENKALQEEVKAVKDWAEERDRERDGKIKELEEKLEKVWQQRK